MTTVVFPLYAGMTHLDFTGPHQFLAQAGIDVVVASMGGEPITSHGLTFASLTPLEKIERCDVICVPGGTGCLEAAENPAFLDAIRRLATSAKYITSVCTGSLILAAAGVLKGKRAACHWGWRELLPEFGVIPDPARVVRDGNVITGGGVTAGIDFALTLLEELRGADAAQAIQLVLEYAPAPPFDAGRPESAPEAIRAMLAPRIEASIAANRPRAKRLATA